MVGASVSVRIPHHLGLPTVSAMLIQTTMPITTFTKGIRKRKNHQSGFLAIASSRKMFVMGIHRNQSSGVSATLCGFFGVLAVLLAAIGLCGVISFTVAQRTNEIGVRMALGAQRSGVIGLILGEVAVLIAIGVVVGAGLTLAGSKATSSLLFGLKPHDPLTLALAVFILAAMALWRASFPRVGPRASIPWWGCHTSSPSRKCPATLR